MTEPVVLFSRVLESSALTIPTLSGQRTSRLLDRGLVTIPAGRGLLAYSTLGTSILRRVEDTLLHELAAVGHTRLELPAVMSDDDLARGQPVGDQFASKIVPVGGRLSGHHLMTSPETLIARLGDGFDLSHRCLPLRLSYATRIFRQMTETRSLLTAREFRVVGALVLRPSATRSQDLATDLAALDTAFAKGADALGVPVRQVRHGPLTSELAYACEEGDLGRDPPVDHDPDPGAACAANEANSAHIPDEAPPTRLLSLSVGYLYTGDCDFPLRYRGPDNTMHPPQAVTAAICSNRLLYACFDASRDRHGFALPATVRPFDTVLVPRAASDIATAVHLADVAHLAGLRAAVDDRVTRAVRDRCAFASHIGAPASVVVHGPHLAVTPRGHLPRFDAPHSLGERRWTDAVRRLDRPTGTVPDDLARSDRAVS